MPESLETLKSVLDDFDRNTEAINDWDVSSALRGVPRSEGVPFTELPLALRGELLAFDFMENHPSDTNPWDTYFGPMMTFRNTSNELTASPSLDLVTPEILDYWTERSATAQNPVLAARYANLVWDLTKSVRGRGADVCIARRAIDELVRAVRENRVKHEVNAIEKLRRALSVAISIRDSGRIAAVRDFMISYEDQIADDEHAGIWGFSFDELLDNPKVSLATQQETKLLGDMEARLARLTTAREGAKVNSLAVERAVERLQRYYSKHSRQHDVRRVTRLLGQAYEAEAEQGPGLRALVFLQQAYDAYSQCGLREEAEALSQRLEQAGRDANAGMKTVSTEFSVPTAEMNAYIAEITSGDVNVVFKKVALQYVVKFNEVAQDVQAQARDYPLSYLMSKKLLDHDGRPVAIVGPIEADLEGHVVSEMAQRLHFATPFLGKVMEAVAARISKSADQIVDYLFQSPVFEESRRSILQTGIECYLAGEHLVAAHLLVPQIEHAVRTLLRLVGGSIYKKNAVGGLDYRTLADILRDPLIVGTLGDPIATYLDVLLVERRGWNIRNIVCHGLVPPNAFRSNMTDRIVHALLVLALAQEEPEGGSNKV